MSVRDIKIGILGASGYTGAELLRLLGNHPRAEVVALTAERQAGKAIGEVFPHLGVYDLPGLVKIDEVDTAALDVIFCCLPHGTTQTVIAALPSGLKVIDLSADFRLYDPELYAEIYGHPHQAVSLQADAVYGLAEQYRDRIERTWLVANPGCFTTTAELPLIPLLKAGLIDAGRIVIDAKSGVSGAGRDAKQGSLFTEVSEGFHAYGVANHRHAPEIDQCLSDFTTSPIRVSFTPHLVPMNRGIFATIYVDLAPGQTAEDLQTCLGEAYAGEPFVKVLPYRGLPATRHVRGTNLCLIAVHPDRVPGRAILLSVTDNLVKGASGQALQNMNIMLGIDETLGLTQRPVMP